MKVSCKLEHVIRDTIWGDISHEEAIYFHQPMSGKLLNLHYVDIFTALVTFFFT